MLVHSATGLPLVEEFSTVDSMPYTLSQAIVYYKRLESFNELPKDKRPPRYMWDRPVELSDYLEHVWDKDGGGSKSNFYEYDPDNVE